MGLKAKFSTGRWARRTCRTAALWLEFTRTVSGTVEDAAGDRDGADDTEEVAGDPEKAVRGTEVGGGIGPEKAADGADEAFCGREAGGGIGPEERDDCGASGAETM